jgi:hypothetical protein
MKREHVFRLTEKQVKLYRRAYFGRLEGEPPVTINDMEAANELQNLVGAAALDGLHDLLKDKFIKSGAGETRDNIANQQYGDGSSQRVQDPPAAPRQVLGAEGRAIILTEVPLSDRSPSSLMPASVVGKSTCRGLSDSPGRARRKRCKPHWRWRRQPRRCRVRRRPCFSEDWIRRRVREGKSRPH